MISEIVRFTDNLDQDLKLRGISPKEGLHIMLRIIPDESEWKIDTENIKYRKYTKKTNTDDFLIKCAHLALSSWCINTNKCFDLPAKAIHTCSPYCVAFKNEHRKGNSKYIENQKKKKSQIYDRFGSYFAKALGLLEDEEERSKLLVFKSFFTQRDTEGYFENILQNIETDINKSFSQIQEQVSLKQEQSKNSNDKAEKASLKDDISTLNNELELYKPLSEGEYIIFYLDEPQEKYKKANNKYLADKLFNTPHYTTEANDDGDIFGTSDFFNGFNSNMPFRLHQTATFDISGRITDKDAKSLYEFAQLLPRRILPNPIPIFIFGNELQEKYIGLFQESGCSLSYRELVERLWNTHKNEFGNYYLLFYQNTKNGLVFHDMDFVSKFEYELMDHENNFWEIKNLFGIANKRTLYNVFDFQNIVLQIIFNNNLIVRTKDKSWIYKYFDDIDENFVKSSKNFIKIMEYRKAFYDFIYKSKRKSITPSIFQDIVLTSIMEDIRLDKNKAGTHSEYFNIIKKLNIWFSLYENFDLNYKPGEPTMASKLKEYRAFVKDYLDEKTTSESADVEKLAFSTGQVMYYLLTKSKSADQSFQRLDRYFQQSSFDGMKTVLANEFAKYKHENYSKKFRKVAAFVLSYEAQGNFKKYLPQLLAGVFSDNMLFSDKEKDRVDTTEKEKENNQINPQGESK